MLFLSALLLFKLLVGAFAAELGGPFFITNVHTGLAMDVRDKYMRLEPRPLVANHKAEYPTASQLWYTGKFGTNGAIVMASAQYPETDVWVFAEGDGLLAATGSVDDAAPVVFQHLPGNVTAITIGGRAVTSSKEPGEELKLTEPKSHDERQQWRFTLVY